MTSTIIHLAPGAAGTIDDALVTSIRERLANGDPEGARLNDVLHGLAAEGHDLQTVTKTIVGLIRCGAVDLTADRTLRWAAS